MTDTPSDNPPAERRLAAILAADIAGYSRLMGDDEDATVRDLKAHQAVVLPMVGQFGGRIIDTAGDGILAQFPSAVRAVECAVEIQKIMAERNFDVPENRRMQFRIGLNLGDIIHDEFRVYGDGINIAARLESIANPGGIYISENIREAVFGKLGLPLVNLGLKSLKNIPRPVRAYQVQLDGAASPRSRSVAIFRNRWIPACVILVLAASAAGLAWWISPMGSRTRAVGSTERGDGSGVGQLRLRFEEEHDRLEPCCVRGIIKTHEYDLSFTETGVSETRRSSFGGAFSSGEQGQYVFGAANGKVKWKITGSNTYQRIQNDFQSQMIISIGVVASKECTVDIEFKLKPGFIDALYARADNGELAHFSLPKLLNSSCKSM